jgi:molybdenum cofactor guanylyltransferase
MSGLILCGGGSRRMGTSKALLEFGGEALLTRVAKVIAAVADPIVIVAAPEQSLPSLPSGCVVVEDHYPREGPLGGLVTGIGHLAERDGYTFVCGCDYPFLTEGFLRALLNKADGEDVVSVAAERKQPLGAWYRTGALAGAESLFAEGERRLTAFYDGLRSREVKGAELKGQDLDRVTMSINSPEELEVAKRLAGI